MKEHSRTHSNHDEHGSTVSYVIGFILSLVFTIIPYYLVVNKVFTGGALLAAILGIALVQMTIQLVFFLHFGRGPKPLYNVVFFFATAGVIVITIGASLFIMDNLYRTMSPEEMTIRLAQEEGIAQIGGRDTGACAQNKASHTLTISGEQMTPAYIEAQRCDTLVIVNEDGATRELAFGAHPDDVTYGGHDTVNLDDSRPEIITLNETGEFVIHDHMNPNLTSIFNVLP